MESSARAAKSAPKKNRWFPAFLVGILLGALGAVFLPGLLRPYLPGALRGERVEVAGLVEAKSREPERLLLTIGGETGAVLVTYTKKVAEIDLLVEPGDSVVLAMREYAPFVEDPAIRRVQKSAEFSRTQRRAEPVDAVPDPSAVERRTRAADTTGSEEFRAPGDAAGEGTPEAAEAAPDSGGAPPPPDGR